MKELEKYRKDKLTIDLVKANIFGIVILIPIVILFGLPYFLIWYTKGDLSVFIENFTFPRFVVGSISIFVIMVLGIILHELIHGITWARFTKNGFKSIKFGVLWKMLTPYCHCTEPLNVNQYIWGAITPAIILGIIPSLIAISIGSIELLIFGIYFTMAGFGDYLVINLIRKEKRTDLVQDHPSEAGCYIYREI